MALTTGGTLKKALLIVAAILCFPQSTFACSCPPGQLDGSTFQSWVERADVVFLARIVESKTTPTFVEIGGKRYGTVGTIDATFAVDKVYKWKKAEPTLSVTVRTVDSEGACGFAEWAKPDSAEAWLVFATYSGKDVPQPSVIPGNLPEGTLTALLCSGTASLERVRPTFNYLESLVGR